MSENKTKRKQIDLQGKTVLITGASGFIGWNLAKRLQKAEARKKPIQLPKVEWAPS